MRNALGAWPLRRVRVRGPSMAPALASGDVLLASRWVPPRPGLVAFVRWESRPGQLSVKRLVRREGTGWYVLGDNPAGSTDSRELGAAVVVGVAVLRLWPRPALLGRTASAQVACRAAQRSDS